jgi:hypothetical protein
MLGGAYPNTNGRYEQNGFPFGVPPTFGNPMLDCGEG